MNYNVISKKKLFFKTIGIFLFLFIFIYCAYFIFINYLEDYSWDHNETNRIYGCDSYYYDHDYGNLRDYLTLYNLYDDTYAIYWESVNGFDDYEKYLMWNKTDNIDKKNEYKQKVIDNADQCEFSKNQKQLNGYKEAIE